MKTLFHDVFCHDKLSRKIQKKEGHPHVTSAENNGTAEKRANTHRIVSTTTITTRGGGVDMLRTFFQSCVARNQYYSLD
jgi:hypothetical protein